MNPHSSLAHQRSWTARILLVLLILILLLSLIRISLPLIVASSAKYWFMSEDVTANIGDVELSLLDGTFAIHQAVGTNRTGKGFSLGRFAIDWQWQPLLDHRLIINQIEVDALSVDAQFLDQGNMNIAGLAINGASNETLPENNAPSASTPWDVTVKNIGLSDITLCLQRFSNTDHILLDYCAGLTRLAWAGDAAFTPSIAISQAVSSASTTNTPLYVQGTLTLKDITLMNNQLRRKLLKISTVDVNNLMIETLNNIRINDINIEKFSAMERSASKDNTTTKDELISDHDLTFERLNITPIHFSQMNQLNLGTIALTDTSAYLLINKEGRMNFEQWLPEAQPITATTDTKNDATSSSTTTEPFHFSFDTFDFATKQQLVFVDNSLKAPLSVNVHDINFTLTKIDNHKPDQTSHLSLAMTIDTHGQLKMEADLTPLSERPSINGKGEIAGLDLRTFDPLSKQHVGHSIKSGQLDADLKLTVNQGIIDSSMGLALHQFELKTLSKEEAEALNSELGFPLNSSLSLLRDRDNSIHLDIPVTGDIDNPAFNPRDAIMKASAKAVTAAVLHYYTPFGLVFAAESLFDIATALHFDPILFNAGTDELTPAHTKQLDKLADLMTERPGIHLTLCAISNSADRNVHFPPTPPENSEENPPPATPNESPSKEEFTLLKQLAESRSANIKQYLVSTKSVPPSHLIECAPEYKQEGIAGVEISI